jgi:hypothetical protein
VGKYHCLIQGNWDTGLPMLAKSDYPTLRPLAERELKGELDATKLADDWFTHAEKLPENMRVEGLRRAEKNYRRALRTASGLDKTRIEKRLTELVPVTSPFRKNEWVDTLAYVDPAKHSYAVVCESRENGITIPQHKDGAGFDIPVEANGQYEICIQATALNLQRPHEEALSISLPGVALGAFFALCGTGDGRKNSGISNIDGKKRFENNSGVLGVPSRILMERFILTVQVEKSGTKTSINSMVNGKNYSRWSGVSSSLSSGKKIDPNRFYCGTWWSSIIVHTVEFKVLEGEAWLTE